MRTTRSWIGGTVTSTCNNRALGRQVAWLDETRGPRDRGISADDVQVDLEDVGALRVIDRQLVLGEVVAAAADPLGQVLACSSMRSTPRKQSGGVLVHLPCRFFIVRLRQLVAWLGRGCRCRPTPPGSLPTQHGTDTKASWQMILLRRFGR